MSSRTSSPAQQPLDTEPKHELETSSVRAKSFELGDRNLLEAARTVPPEEIIRDEQERRRIEHALVRKIDLRIMPILVVLYILNYLDRNSIGSARDYGLQTDLKLSDTDYSLAVSILFVGYIALQVPSNLLLAKTGRPSVYIPTVVFLWGILSGCTAACTNLSSLLAVRTLLGVCESSFFPGARAYAVHTCITDVSGH